MAQGYSEQELTYPEFRAQVDNQTRPTDFPQSGDTVTVKTEHGKPVGLRICFTNAQTDGS